MQLRMDRHEIADLRHPVGGEEARQQHVGIREIELPVHGVVQHRLQGEVAASFVIQQRSEDGWGVERRQAEEIDAAVGADQGNGLQVTDDAVRLDRRVRGQGLAPVG